MGAADRGVQMTHGMQLPGHIFPFFYSMCNAFILYKDFLESDRTDTAGVISTMMVFCLTLSNAGLACIGQLTCAKEPPRGCTSFIALSSLLLIQLCNSRQFVFTMQEEDLSQCFAVQQSLLVNSLEQNIPEGLQHLHQEQAASPHRPGLALR